MGEAVAVLRRQDNLHLEACRLVTPGIVELLASEVGAERLLFGSGAPYWEVTPTLDMIRHADISEESREAILGGNARRIYRLGSGGQP
jgi:predicted TIM-barrel fold metal-dependent hydrolase